MNNTVLITGGLGYVGGRVASYLKEFRPDMKVVVTTRKSTADRPSWAAGIPVRQMDLLNGDSIKAALKGINIVIHLAAVNEIECLADPEKAFHINSCGTLKMVKAAERERVRRFIYFSTAHVYGTPLVGTISELTPTRPIHPYAITHRAAEDFVLAVNAAKSVSGLVLRLSNGFGAPADASIDRWTLLVNDLCRQAVTTKKIMLRSSGLQLRDFVTLGDICRCVCHLLDLSVEKCDDGLFNLGGECTMSVIDMAKRVAARCSCLHGFVPEIGRAKNLEAETVAPLSYSVDKTKRTGFVLERNIDDEIDDTLMLCTRAFGGTL